MNLDAALLTFIAEARELLEDMEGALLELEQAPDEELVNAVFRAAHTIKGSAGLFGLDHVVAFTHVVESVFERVRGGEQAVSAALVLLLLSSRDHIGAMIDAVDAGEHGLDPDLATTGQALLGQLQAYLGGASLPVAAPPAQCERMASEEGGADVWHISLRFGPDVLRNGMDPLSLLRYLGTLGRIAGIVTLLDQLPGPAALDPESCYLGFEIALDSSASKESIEAAFDFVREDCSLSILPPHGRIEAYLKLLAEQPAEGARLGDMLVACGTVTAAELERALACQQGVAQAAPLGDILVQQGQVERVVVDAALARQKQVHEQKAQENRSMRIDADKVDRLIDLVGELTVAGAAISLTARRREDADLADTATRLNDLVSAVRDSALQLRMVRIGATFKRFQRVVHDVAAEIGKDVVLEVEGEDAELDKAMVERIADPLTHLIRNSLDHGIEPHAQRLAAGKPAQGTVRLRARHEGGAIVLEVADDGGGLRRDKILAKARERGLVGAEQIMSDQEVYGLIFEPGFSTAEQVTNLSGRGVGMDVVKRNITALRGSISIDSQAGQGTTISIRLPLTLALIDGFLVEAGGSLFVLPLETVEECISAEEGMDAYVDLRGRLLPLLRLREVFGLDAEPAERQNIVVVRHAGRVVGLVVDALLGEFQTVVKPLAPVFKNVRCISGSTILGSGELALVLDLAALLTLAGHRAARALAA